MTSPLPKIMSTTLPSASMVGQFALQDTSGALDPSYTDGSVWRKMPTVKGGSAKVASGEVTLDGSNPTSVTTGLATITAATVSLKTASALGDDPNAVSCDYGGSVTAGQLDIYAWKNTSGTDPTQVASTNNSIVISWIAFGT